MIRTMKRLSRWLFVLLFLAFAGISAWWAVHQFLLPAMVEDRLVAALESIGLDGSAARVDKLGAERAVISNLIIGSEELITIDTAEITYALDEAIEGRINTVLLTGAWLRLSVKDGKLDLGQLGAIATPRPDASAPGSQSPNASAENPSGGGPSGGGGDLRFKKIELRSSRITVDVGSMGLFIPISGTIEHHESGGLEVDLRGELFDRRLTVSGILRATDDGVAADDVHIHLSPGDVPIAAAGFTLVGTTFTFNCNAQLNGDRLVVKLDAGSRLDAAGSAWKIEPHFTQPLIQTGGTDNADAGTTIAARFESLAPITHQQSGVDVTVDRAHGEFTARYIGNQPVTVDGSVSFDDATITHQPTDTRLENVRAQIPIAHNSPGGEPGVFAIGTVGVGDDTLPAIIGSVRIHNAQLELNADWRVVEEISASIRVEADAEHLIAQVTVPPTEITKPRALADAFTPLRELDITGTLEIDANLWWQDNELAPDIRIFAHELNIARADVDAAVTGLTGEIRFDRVNPLSTSTNQRLTADAVRLTDLELHDLVTTFQIESTSRVFLESTRWRFGKSGRFFAHAVRFDLQRPVIDTNLFIENLEVADWLTLLAQEKVDATGRMYGRIPIRFDPAARAMLRFGDGYLYAESDDGSLKFRDADTVAKMLAQHDPRFAPGGELSDVRQDVSDALADFRYDMFRFRITRDPETGKARAHLSTKGRGRAGKKQEIGSLNVTIAGDFETAANIALFSKTALGKRIDRSLGTILPRANTSTNDPEMPMPDPDHGVPTDADFEQFFD